VVAPRAAGPEEIVEHGVSGLLFAPANAAEAAGHVLRIISDPSLAERMGAAARAAVERRFTAARQVEQMERVLADAVKAG
jgi:phosphatidylinositol alpha 1,6-mannosyltransferase